MYGLYPLGLLAGILFFFVFDYMDKHEEGKTSQKPDVKIVEAPKNT